MGTASPSVLKIISLFILEVRGILTGAGKDFLGLMLNACTWSFIFVAYCWAPMYILTNIDPVHKLYQIYYPSLLTNMYTRSGLALIRFFAIQRMNIEPGRVYLTILIPYVTILETFMNILKLLRSRQLTRQKYFIAQPVTLYE